MANLITLFRFVLLFPLIVMAYSAPPHWQVLNAPLLILIVALDGVDGWVARRRNETSVFGSIFDVAIDRAVETVLWVVLADLDLVPIWVALTFIIRGTVVDAIRYAAISRGQTAFGMMRSPWGRFIVAGRFMRGFYGVIKAVTFAAIFIIQPWPALFPELWQQWGNTAGIIASLLVYTSVALCLIRGAPVILEFLVETKVIKLKPVPMIAASPATNSPAERMIKRA
jgi:CDP-diacylglycerol--glycerol-3-phosphate 3-phosphatidyltransferase